MSAADVKPIALYVHWPWCVRKCPYCDFNSHAIGSGADEAGYIRALLKDVDAAVALAGRRPVSSVFFGGGTPSLMSVAGFETLMNGLRERLPFAENAEITLEANPGTHEAARFAGYVAVSIAFPSVCRALTMRGSRRSGASTIAGKRCKPSKRRSNLSTTSIWT